MKQLLITSVLATTLASGSVLAGSAATQGDLDQIFAAKDKSTEVATLSHTEMQKTEGAWVANAVGAGAGALGGHYGYMAGAAYGRSYSFWGHMGAIATGAGLGAINPVRGVGSAFASVGGGALSGGINGWAGSRGSTVRW